MTIQKHRLTGIFLLVAVVAAVLPFASSRQLTQAATGTQLSLSPASQTVTTGSNLIVSIAINTGGASVNTVQSVFTYAPANFNLVSVAAGGSFSNFSNTPTSGSIAFTAAPGAGAPAVNGTQTVATITLHATGTGTSAMNLASVCASGDFSLTCSAAYDSGTYNNDLNNVVGGSNTVAAAPVTPPPAPAPAPTPAAASSSKTTTKSTSSSSTKKPTSGSSTTTTTTPTTTTTNPAPVISDVKVSAITTNGAVISWQTNLPATSVVEYGLNANYGLMAKSGDFTTSHSVILDSTYLTQGTTFHFAVVSATATGASSTSDAQQFTTTGFTVTIRVLDSHGKPIKDAEVTSDGQTKTTDDSGVATFQNLPAGSQVVTIKSGKVSTKRTMTIGKLDPMTGKYQLQHFDLTASRGSSSASYVVVALVALTAAGLTFFITNNPSRRLLKGMGSHAGNISDSGPVPGNASPISTVAAPKTLNSKAPNPGQIISPDNSADTPPKDDSSSASINNSEASSSDESGTDTDTDAESKLAIKPPETKP